MLLEIQKNWNFHTPGRNVKECNHFGKVWQFGSLYLKKLNIHVPYSPIPRNIPKGKEIYV